MLQHSSLPSVVQRPKLLWWQEVPLAEQNWPQHEWPVFQNFHFFWTSAKKHVFCPVVWGRGSIQGVPQHICCLSLFSSKSLKEAAAGRGAAAAAAQKVARRRMSLDEAKKAWNNRAFCSFASAIMLMFPWSIDPLPTIVRSWMQKVVLHKHKLRPCREHMFKWKRCFEFASRSQVDIVDANQSHQNFCRNVFKLCTSSMLHRRTCFVMCHKVWFSVQFAVRSHLALHTCKPGFLRLTRFKVFVSCLCLTVYVGSLDCYGDCVTSPGVLTFLRFCLSNWAQSPNRAPKPWIEGFFSCHVVIEAQIKSAGGQTTWGMSSCWVAE